MGLKKVGSPAALTGRLMRTLNKPRSRALTYNQLLNSLLRPGENRLSLQQQLEDLLAKGFLADPGSKGSGFLSGTIQGNRRGFAFLKPDLSGQEDIYIKARHLKGAVHRDRVLVRLNKQRRGRREEGEVVLIRERGSSRLVGTLERKGKRCYVVPDERCLPQTVEVSARELKKTRSGEKVVVKIDQWAETGQKMRGRVIEKIGPADSSRTDQKSIRYKFNLPGEFPKEVLRELKRLPGEDQIERIAREQNRQDLRDLFMITIDGESARDFDDAISLEESSAPGRYLLGVHIADVSFYVREGGALDKEAFDRGTSVYLVDQSIPMLPPLLSEHLCSLQAGRERLALSVLMEVNLEGDLFGCRFFPSMIKVKERLTYTQVQAYLEEGDSGRGREKLLKRLQNMDRLAGSLKKLRLQRGALDLDLPEAEIKLNRHGYPISIERRNLGRSESLIEEFMILCNEAVAGQFSSQNRPGLYRSHAFPETEKIKAFKETIGFLGYRLPGRPGQITQLQLNQLLQSSKGQKEERLIKYLLLRSLPQARYSAANEGHFGLASGCYTHFTAPIRRYPDLIVHRLLREYGRPGKVSAKRLAALRSQLPDIAKHASERERVAMEAERASEDLAKALYMENKVGEEFPGIISGVTSFGMFVELENTVEGMIPLSDLDDDYYVYLEKQASLVGKRRRKIYRMGDEVQVKVVRISRQEGNITFGLVE